MTTRMKILRGRYCDSVSLMLAARQLRSRAGVSDAAIVMATAQNKSILESSGFCDDEVKGSAENDLVIAVAAESAEVCEAALAEGIAALDARKAHASTGEHHPRSLAGALQIVPRSNLALISVPGRHAAAAAHEALDAGLHVMLFSDNVSVEDEVALKLKGRERGLLVMGPDCGTSLINGVPLGFANQVRRGPVGIVAASGTGLQEVSVLLDRLGVGVSQAVGVGGRDISEAVGGIAMLQALHVLCHSPETQVVVVVSKPPASPVMQRVESLLAVSAKPVVTVWLGAEKGVCSQPHRLSAATLEEGALWAAALVLGKDPSEVADDLGPSQPVPVRSPDSPRRWLRGLFCGGTLATEANLILKQRGVQAYSNVTSHKALTLSDPWMSVEHTLVDMGDDLFTVGRPHPMIDDSLRNQRLLREAGDPGVALLLFDVVLGWGSNPEPLRDLGPVLKKVGKTAPEIHLVCSVCGTDRDPQNRAEVVKALEGYGVTVLPTNAAAARHAADLLVTGEKK